MSSFTSDVARHCRDELKRWKDGAGKETQDPYCAYVGQYWAYGVKNANVDGRTTYQDSKGRKFRPAWSSAFVSYIYRKAGAGSEFYYHEGHIHYVVKALRDAAAGGVSKFVGRDPTIYVPKVGDLISAARGPKGVTYKNILSKYGSKIVPKGNFIPSHSDIVVAVDHKNGTVVTIGGNVAVDTVGEKTWRLKSDSTLQHGPNLICVIECLL